MGFTAPLVLKQGEEGKLARDVDLCHGGEHKNGIARVNFSTGLMADGTEKNGTEHDTYSWKRLVD